jgi:hypothetical protein
MTQIEKITRRLTRGALDGSYGADRGRQLVAEFAPGDLIVMRPLGTRRPVKISLFDAYRYAVKCRVNLIERRIRELRKSGVGRAEARRQAEREASQ